MTHKKKAEENYKKFHKCRVKKLREIEFTMPKALTFLGEAFAIEYKSDKVLKGHPVKTRRYRHKFGKQVKIYLHPDKKWILISGGNFRVTDWMRD